MLWVVWWPSISEFDRFPLPSSTSHIAGGFLFTDLYNHADLSQLTSESGIAFGLLTCRPQCHNNTTCLPFPGIGLSPFILVSWFCVHSCQIMYPCSTFRMCLLITPRLSPTCHESFPSLRKVSTGPDHTCRTLIYSLGFQYGYGL